MVICQEAERGGDCVRDQSLSVSPELLLPPAQSAGTLCAPVVPQPGGLGPVSLPTPEQVSHGKPSSHPAGWVERAGPYPPMAEHPRPGQREQTWSLLGVSSPQLPPQAARLLSESHRTQDVRPRGPGLHLPQLHHHCPGAARHRPGQHRESLEANWPSGWGGVRRTWDLPLVSLCRSGPSSASPTTSSQPSLWWR